MAGAMAGVILLLGVFNLGQIVNFIPSAVIAGFTSGIAIVIFVGQIDNLLGVDTEAAENSLLKLLHYMQGGFTPNRQQVKRVSPGIDYDPVEQAAERDLPWLAAGADRRDRRLGHPESGRADHRQHPADHPARPALASIEHPLGARRRP
ncbi:MAG: SulP family inorganic anion transporter [Anaerolineae bacterium]